MRVADELSATFGGRERRRRGMVDVGEGPTMAKKKQPIGLRIPDRVMAFVKQEQDARPEEPSLTDVVTELMEIAIDLRMGLGDADWAQVVARAIGQTPRRRPGEILVQMLKEGRACLERESSKKK